MEQRIERKSSAKINLLNFVLGIWVAIAPFVLGFPSQRAAGWNDVIVGLAVLILALFRTTTGNAPSIANAILGLLLIASPYVLGFASLSALLWNNIVLGAVICFAAFIASGRRSEGESR